MAVLYIPHCTHQPTAFSNRKMLRQTHGVRLWGADEPSLRNTVKNTDLNTDRNETWSTRNRYLSNQKPLHSTHSTRSASSAITTRMNAHPPSHAHKNRFSKGFLPVSD